MHSSISVFTRLVSIYLSLVPRLPSGLAFSLLPSPLSLPFFLSPHTFDLQLVAIAALSESSFCFLSASGAILQCRNSVFDGKGMVLFADGQLFWAQLCFSSDKNFREALWSKTARGKLRGHWRGYESLNHVPWWQAAYSSWPIEAEMNGSWGGVWPKLELQLG